MIAESESLVGEPVEFTVKDVVRLLLPRRTRRKLTFEVQLPGGPALLTLQITKAGFGGLRYWFTCPRCHHRAAKLYTTVPTPLCRSCFGYPFPSSRRHRDRAWHSWGYLAQKLGNVQSLLSRRYLRLARRGKLERQAAALEAALCAALAEVGDLELIWERGRDGPESTFGHLK